MELMYTYLAIAFGGALGALSRHWLTSAMGNLNGTDFPLGTFVVNLLGSFLIGLVFVVFAEKHGAVRNGGGAPLEFPDAIILILARCLPLSMKNSVLLMEGGS